MPFSPSPWLRNAHLQTMWAPLFRKTPLLQRSRERLTLPDTDFLDLDWFNSASGPNAGDIDHRPLAVLFHGLTGSSNSPYILGLQQALSEQNWCSVAVNFRGCSGRPNRLPRAYHSGETGDIHFVLSTLRHRFPTRQIIAVGYSLGGNALCKWLGEQGEQACINAAIVVSAPYQLARCATQLDRGFSKVYRTRLIQELTSSIEQKKNLFLHTGQHHYWKALDDLGPLSDLKSFWQFDNQVVAPLHGFVSAEDYYERSSARQYVPYIATPTLLIHAMDDPFMPNDVAPTSDECPDSVTLVLTKSGGHVGFVTGSWIPWKTEFWLEQYIPAWLAGMIKS
ncbi:hydrolase [Hahella ganghwensis]|uniref:hydrolase n=1 Tax=Hahella ganghwensis TaxID=286420 RepID=UPI00039BDF8D|nr:hydrolase [Hahella ganghwensis]